MNPKINKLTSAVGNLESSGAADRAIGLMHLLAVAYNSNDDRNAPPTQAEADGITWLAQHTGEELKAALSAVFTAAAEADQSPSESAA